MFGWRRFNCTMVISEDTGAIVKLYMTHSVHFGDNNGLTLELFLVIVTFVLLFFLWHVLWRHTVLWFISIFVLVLYQDIHVIFFLINEQIFHVLITFHYFWCTNISNNIRFNVIIIPRYNPTMWVLLMNFYNKSFQCSAMLNVMLSWYFPTRKDH